MNSEQKDVITARITLRDQLLGDSQEREQSFDRKRLVSDIGYRGEVKAWIYGEVDGMLRELVDRDAGCDDGAQD